jgi:hypothetical protein
MMRRCNRPLRLSPPSPVLPEEEQRWAAGAAGKGGQSETAGWGFLSLLAFKMTTYERPPLAVSAPPLV